MSTEAAAADRPPAPPPERFGPYLVQSRIGTGGQGSVYRVLNPRLGRVEALKLLRLTATFREEDRTRFEREVRVLAKLNHPGIIRLYDAGLVEGRPYYTMELVEGESVGDLLERELSLAPRRALRIVRDAARALDAAHAGQIVHRDVKPHNLLIAGERVIVTDFGLAREKPGPSSLSSPGTAFGTPAYAPPEQLGGHDERIGPRSDVYGLGATLYEMLTGEPPFDAETNIELMKKVVEEDPPPPRRFVPGLSADVETIVLKCLEKDPDRRYGSAAELADDIDRYLGGEVIRARPISMAGRLARRVRRQPLPWTLGVLLALTALSAAAWGVHRLVREDRLARAQSHVERGRNRIERARTGLYLPKPNAARYREEQAHARAEFEAALALAPDHAPAWYWLGRSFRDEGRLDEAQAALERAVDADASLSPAWMELARVHLDRMIRDVLTASGDQADVMGSHLERARACYAAAGDFGEGIEREIARGYALFAEGRSAEFTPALERYAGTPGIEELHMLLGWSAKGEERIAHYAEAIRLRPGYPVALLLHGAAVDDAGDPAAAIADYDAALRLRPDMAEAHFNRGNSRYDLGLVREALDDYNRAEASGLAMPALFVHRARCHEEFADDDAAMADWAAALRLDPGDETALNNRAVHFILAEDGAAALADLERAVRVKPAEPQIHYNLGRAFALLDRHDEALASLDRAIGLDTDFAPAYLSRARLRAAGGNPRGAVADCTRAIELDASNAMAFVNRAVVHQQLEDDAAALFDFSAALDLNPRLYDVRAGRAVLRRGIGDAAGAAEDLRAALECAPADWSERAKAERMLRELAEF